MTAPPTFFCRTQKLITFFSRQHYSSQFGATFRTLHHNNRNLILRTLCGPFYPAKYIKICTGKLILRPFFTCIRGRPPSPAPPRYATAPILSSLVSSSKCRPLGH